MGIKEIVNDFKYPGIALIFLLAVYIFFVQANTGGLPKLTGFVPAVPTLNSPTTASCTGTTVSWSSVGSNIQYTVLYLTYGSSELKKSAGTSTKTTLTGLVPTVTYNWRVLACPTGSTSLSSCSISGYKSLVQKCKPTSPQATPIDCKSAKVTWTAPTGGNVPSYMVARDIDSTFASSHYGTTLLLYPGISGSATSYTLQGLNPSTTYYVRIYGCQVVNGKSFCDYTSGSYAKVTTPGCSILPAPILKPAKIVDCTTVEFSWNAVTGAGGYVLLVSENSDMTYPIVQKLISPSTTTWPVTGLKSGKNYYWKVYVFPPDNFGLGTYSARGETGIMPACPPLSAPTNLMASSNSDCSLTFSWTNSGAKNYKIELAYSGTELESTGTWQLSQSKAPVQSPYLWSNVPSMIYFWRVLAYNDNIYNGVYTPRQMIEHNACPATIINPSRGYMIGDEQKLFDLINRYRQDLGLKTLAYDANLNKVAEDRSYELMYTSFAHLSNPTFESYLIKYGVSFYTWGEILATNSYSENPADTAFNGFRTSTDHDNIMKGVKFTRMAVGEDIGLYHNSANNNQPYCFAGLFVG